MLTTVWLQRFEVLCGSTQRTPTPCVGDSPRKDQSFLLRGVLPDKRAAIGLGTIGLGAPVAFGRHPARTARPAKPSSPCLHRRPSPRSYPSRCRHPLPKPPI